VKTKLENDKNTVNKGCETDPIEQCKTTGHHAMSALKQIFETMHGSQQQLERLSKIERHAAQNPKDRMPGFAVNLACARVANFQALSRVGVQLQTIEPANDPQWTATLTDQPKI
jgi:hypothetical protein